MNIEDRLQDLRPDATTLEPEWPDAERRQLLDTVLRDTAAPGRTRFAARHGHTRRIAVPLAAAAIAALIAGLLVVVLPGGGDGSGPLPVGEPFTATSVAKAPEVGPGQYGVRTTTYYEAVNGRPTVVQRYEDYVDRDGNVRSLRTAGHGTGRDNGCFLFPFQGPASFVSPNQRFVDALPTDADELLRYMRRHVDGSTSREEAVFVAVGDLLRVGETLTTSALRSALVEVLSRTAGVHIDPDSVDPRGRATVRADFLDPNNRPGFISSLYFHPTTFQLLDETSRLTATTPGSYASQSYDRAPSSASLPATLPSPASMTITESETVVDSLPARVAKCA